MGGERGGGEGGGERRGSKERKWIGGEMWEIEREEEGNYAPIVSYSIH